MAKKQGLNRREFMMSSLLLGAGVAVPSVLSLLQHRRVSAQDKPLRAAMSNTGLAISWCAQGKDAAEISADSLECIICRQIIHFIKRNYLRFR